MCAWWGAWSAEVSNAFDGRRLKVVQSVNGLYSSVYTRILSFWPSVLFFSPLSELFLYMPCTEEKPVLDIKCKERGKKQLFSSVSFSPL